MPYVIGTGKHPQTGQKVLMVQARSVDASAEAWPDVKDLLRTIKAEFPEAYRDIWYEPVAPNGKQFDQDLILPEGAK